VPDRVTRESTGIVLAGAAALGAYEVGVLSYVFDHVIEAGTAPDVYSGTSAGAINAIALAAFADRPRIATRLLANAWSELRLEHVVRPSSIELLSMVVDVTGPRSVWRALQVRMARGGLLDSAPIARLVEQIPCARISEQIERGHLRGAAVSTTRVSDGRAVVFYTSRPCDEPRAAEATFVATRLRADHVRASTAIPLLFPAVAIDGALYCDGGLRQMVPLSPAVHLGADRLLVVNPLPAIRRTAGAAAAVTSPLYLAGKALNALFADRVAADLAHLNRTTAILRAGRRRFGAAFDDQLNDQLVEDGVTPIRPIDAWCIEPSRDLGALAADYVAGPAFVRRTRGPLARLIRYIADGDPNRMGDLLAFLMFDGAFTSELIALGRADARAQHEALATILGPPSDHSSWVAATTSPVATSSQ
jgi:NTE family protein